MQWWLLARGGSRLTRASYRFAGHHPRAGPVPIRAQVGVLGGTVAASGTGPGFGRQTLLPLESRTPARARPSRKPQTRPPLRWKFRMLFEDMAKRRFYRRSLSFWFCENQLWEKPDFEGGASVELTSIGQVWRCDYGCSTLLLMLLLLLFQFMTWSLPLEASHSKDICDSSFSTQNLSEDILLT